MSKPLTIGSKEDFWHDCVDRKKPKKNTESFPYNNYSYFCKKNENPKNKKHKVLSTFLSYQQSTKRTKKNKGNDKINLTNISYINKICNNHPIIKEYMKKPKIKKEDKEIIEKRKKAMFRCLGLYIYGMEYKKTKQLENEKDKKNQIKNELASCTFKPKISNYAKTKKPHYNLYVNKNSNRKTNIVDNNNKKYLNKTIDFYYNGINMNISSGKRSKCSKCKTIDAYHNTRKISSDMKECTFKPKISKNDFKKVFDKSNSLANEKDNAEFFLRLSKARKDYMIKKFSLLPTKDESYDYTLLTITNRINNKQYNNSPIDVYDLKYKNYYRGRNLSLSYQRDNSFPTRKVNIDSSIKFSLRNALLSIDLNEED